MSGPLQSSFLPQAPAWSNAERSAKPWRVFYRDHPKAGLAANLIRSWERGAIKEPVMSTSSGPKDYICNYIWSIFDGCPAVSRVLLLRGQYTQSIPFLLVMNDAGEVCDMAGKEVVIEP